MVDAEVAAMNFRASKGLRPSTNVPTAVFRSATEKSAIVLAVEDHVLAVRLAAD